MKSVISKPLTLFINQSIQNGIFPDKLKVSKIILLYKNRETGIINNYGPIALLPVISKVFEKVIYNQT